MKFVLATADKVLVLLPKPRRLAGISSNSAMCWTDDW